MRRQILSIDDQLLRTSRSSSHTETITGRSGHTRQPHLTMPSSSLICARPSTAVLRSRTTQTTTHRRHTMTTQPTLFGSYEQQTQMMCCPHCRGTGQIPTSENTSRSSDPSTSHRAGDRHRDSTRFSLQSRQGQVLNYLYWNNSTAQECAQGIHKHAAISVIEGTRRRISSLYRLGLIAPSGEERNNPGSDTPSIVWTITDEGIRVRSKLKATGWSQ